MTNTTKVDIPEAVIPMHSSKISINFGGLQYIPSANDSKHQSCNVAFFSYDKNLALSVVEVLRDSLLVKFARVR